MPTSTKPPPPASTVARPFAASLLAAALTLSLAAGCSSAENPSTDGAAGAPGSGGSSGSGGADGGDACAALVAAYGQAYGRALDCNPSIDSVQCHTLTRSSLGCGQCETYVNDSTELDQIRAQYSASCPPVPCPYIACILPVAPVCLPADGGTTGRCGYPPPQ
jgi:hypothetical protein